ncbi:MAG: HD domain-containing protein [Nitrososphaerota archaeon]|nr:HD domain-containing protein [Nitrososphaerota archaeon]
MIDISDPLYNFIKLSDVEKEVVDTHEFQRLRRIKQLSSTYMVYPGANHTRFEHSLGTMHLAGLIGNELMGRGYINEDEVQKLRLSGLLHDVGHGPFSHLFEEIMTRKHGYTHEDVSHMLIVKSGIKDALRKYGYNETEIADLAQGRLANKPFMDSVIAGPLSSDMMDYIQRDSFYTGVLFGVTNVYKVINSFHVYDDQLAIERDALSAFEGLVIARYAMFKAVYFHKTVRAADASLLRALQLADESMDFSDPSRLEEYVELNDDYLLDRIRLNESSDKGIIRAKELIANYLDRRIAKCVYESSFIGKEAFYDKLMGKSNIRLELEREIEDKSGIPNGAVLVDLPVIPSVPHTFKREEFQNIYVVRREGDAVRGNIISASEMPLLGNIMGYMNMVRIYTETKYRAKVEQVIRDLFNSSGAYSKISA